MSSTDRRCHCGAPVVAKGLCKAHYSQQRRRLHRKTEIDVVGNPKAIERFWSRVEISTDNQCWPWQGQTINDYGLFNLGSNNLMAHRVAYTLKRGNIPAIPSNWVVMHTCDNPLCCNPSHLQLVTQSENLKDMARKGRHKIVKVFKDVRGENHPASKLTDKQRQQIVDLYAGRESNGLTQKTIANMFDIHPVTVSRVVQQYAPQLSKGEAWKFGKQKTAKRKYNNWRRITVSIEEIASDNDAVNRFWKQVKVVDNQHCWPWIGSKYNGYGRFGFRSGNFMSHRVSYVLAYGPIPPGEVVTHLCDNRACCNPMHLVADTQQANVKQSWQRRRRRD